jgi:hypothetical protein
MWRYKFQQEMVNIYQEDALEVAIIARGEEK